MKYPALSVWQPWASMLSPEVKDIENRSWPLPEKLLNTPILIHASKKKDSFEWDIANEHYQTFTRMRESLQPLKEFNFGGVIGWAIFDKIVTESDSIWFAGEYGFRVKEYHELEFFPCRGQQKIFYVDLPKEYKL